VNLTIVLQLGRVVIDSRTRSPFVTVDMHIKGRMGTTWSDVYLYCPSWLESLNVLCRVEFPMVTCMNTMTTGDANAGIV
jgi:hypothetical protein